MRSIDDRRSWSEPQQVNDVTPPRKFTYMEFFPDVSGAPQRSGRHRLVRRWQRHGRPGKPAHGASTDQGRTWAPNVRVTTARSTGASVPTAVGDVQGKVRIASTDRGAYIAWDDKRNGDTQNHAQDIYFTRARLDEPGAFFFGRRTAIHPLLAGAIGTSLGLIPAGSLLSLSLRRARNALAGEAERKHPGSASNSLPLTRS